MAAWTAAELFNTFAGDVGVSLTPVGKGRFEVYVDGEKVYDKKERGASGIDMEAITEVKGHIYEKLDALPA